MCADTGYYDVIQTYYFGSCYNTLNKQIHLKYNDSSFAGPFNNSGITDVALFPNPNNGQFSITISLFKKQNFTIFITNQIGIVKLKIPVPETDNYSSDINLHDLCPGTYILKVVSAYDCKNILCIITP
jgi:hypothetical protein